MPWKRAYTINCRMLFPGSFLSVAVVRLTKITHLAQTNQARCTFISWAPIHLWQHHKGTVHVMWMTALLLQLANGAIAN